LHRNGNLDHHWSLAPIHVHSMTAIQDASSHVHSRVVASQRVSGALAKAANWRHVPACSNIKLIYGLRISNSSLFSPSSLTRVGRRTIARSSIARQIYNGLSPILVPAIQHVSFGQSTQNGGRDSPLCPHYATRELHERSSAGPFLS
jgi:hypothetical protein